jgi:hypothetical protein
MLICFIKGFTMEGETSFKERKHFWNKAEEVRHKIYLNTFVSGICDESELDAEIERKTQEQLKTSGWGINFTGWQRVVPYEEMLEIYKEKGWDTDDLPLGKVRAEYVNQWKMDKILKTLTGEQFAQLCREIDLDPNKVKENKL